MKKFINFLLLLLLNGTLFAQIFPKLIPELYPYHDDPTTVFWRQDQHCIPKKISRYTILPNGDSSLHHYQRRLSSSFFSSTQLKRISVNYSYFNATTDAYGIDHFYDTLGRKVNYEYYTYEQVPIPHKVVQTKVQYFYHGNTPWLDSLKTIRTGSYDSRDIFHYDQNDRLASTDHYSRNPSNSPWKKSGFETRIYDVNGQLTRIEVYVSEPSEKLAQVMDINYDNMNRISTIITSNAETNALSEKYAYTYNDADSVSTQILYHWYNGEWIKDRQESIDLGYMNRVDQIHAPNSVGSRLTLKYTQGETCPKVCFDDWLNLNQKYRLYFSYPTTETGEPANENIPLSVYPNPADGIFWIESPVEARLVLQDMLGRIVWQGTSTGKDQLVLPGAVKGQLLLHATLNNQTGVRMILIQ